LSDKHHPTVRESLLQATGLLKNSNDDTAYLDAVLILCHVLGSSKEQLFARLNDPLTPHAFDRFCSLIDRRAGGEPVAYIRGFKEFFGREFRVDHRVLIPRPDTETLIEAALEIIDADKSIGTVHDCCTGSGCIAITLSLERPRLTVTASDLSSDALAVCQNNVDTLAPGKVTLFNSDMMWQVPGRFDLIVANPPYIAEREMQQMRSIGWPEPELALYGGTDGLEMVRRLVWSSLEHLPAKRYLVIEGAYDQRPGLFDVFHNSGFVECRAFTDLASRDRVYIGRRPDTEDDSHAGGV
jgi:release factor glutamine methyltransferase